jgi:L-rhamnose-H+ transport protein
LIAATPLWEIIFAPFPGYSWLATLANCRNFGIVRARASPIQRDFTGEHHDPQSSLGVVLHAIGGLASAVFYLPYRKVKHWSWESYWIVGGVFSWIVAPWVIAYLAVPGLAATLSHAPGKSVFWSFLFGMLWGVGGVTFGLTVRYLGFALGTAMALGYCAVFGTLLPPIVAGAFGGVIKTASGLVVMGGVVICVLGIVVSGIAGMAKEREVPEKEKTASVKEFSFKKGVWVATFCGIMSACMSYGFAAESPSPNSL